MCDTTGCISPSTIGDTASASLVHSLDRYQESISCGVFRLLMTNLPPSMLQQHSRWTTLGFYSQHYAQNLPWHSPNCCFKCLSGKALGESVGAKGLAIMGMGGTTAFRVSYWDLKSPQDSTILKTVWWARWANEKLSLIEGMTFSP